MPWVRRKCDVVEFHRDEKGVSLSGYDGTWKPVPVEYKHGEPKENNADELQLCAQAICLEEMFQTNIDGGYLYYGQNRRRSHVEFTDGLREEVRKAATEMHDLFQRGYTPNVKPAKKCKACSLENLCVPRLRKAVGVRAYIEREISERD